MIRPFTLLTAALAVGSGYYLYQAKHRTRLLDDEVEAVAQQTAAAETRIAVLRAEWALENAPTRLADLASRYLLLAPMQPDQAVSMTDLASHLPPPSAPGAAPPPVAEPDLPLLAGLPEPGIYAGLDDFTRAGSETPPASSPLAVAAVPAPSFPPFSTALPGSAPTTRPGTATTLSPASAPAPAPAQTLPPQSVRAGHFGAAPERLALPRLRPAPVLTSALGGAYPDLPPPAPLSGSH